MRTFLALSVLMSFCHGEEDFQISKCLKEQGKTLDDLLEASGRLKNHKMSKPEDDGMIGCAMKAMGVISENGVNEAKFEELLQGSVEYNSANEEEIQNVLDCLVDHVEPSSNVAQMWSEIRKCIEDAETKR